jgi:hypothetical protein
MEIARLLKCLDMGMRPLLIGALLGSSLYAQDIAGDWKGTISNPTLEVRVALHITKTGNGGLNATLDSVDQGALGLAVSSVSLKNSTLKFTVDAAMGTYEGKVAPNGGSIDGIWTQGSPFPLKFERGSFKAVVHKPAKPSDIDGAWSGELTTAQGNEHLVFHIRNTADGLTATLQSGAKILPVTSVTRTAAGKVSVLKMEIKAVGAGFEGTITPDLKQVLGFFTQAGTKQPIILRR